MNEFMVWTILSIKKKIFINYIIINEIHKNEVFPKFRVLGHQLIRLYLKPPLSDT